MKKSAIGVVVLVLVFLGALIYAWSRSEAPTTRPSDAAAEEVAFNFMRDAIAAAPPTSNVQASERVAAALSQSAKQRVQSATFSADLAQFIGVQDMPDQGVSVEDLQIVSQSEAYLVVGLNYSGSGRVLREVHVVTEDGEWKVDRVSIPSTQAQQFEASGNLVRDNPGMLSGVWYLLYEEPGAPGLLAQLAFASSSVCARGAVESTCESSSFAQGQRVHLVGTLSEDGVVQVVRLELN